MFPAENHPDLLVGLGSPDDAAVHKLNEEQALVMTTDFFPPVVDDAFDFGAIAAANALSDVYAMGGRPISAINLVAYPDGLDLSILSEILRGGAEKVAEAGAVLSGGHTVTDKEPKYGLSVTGIVHPDRIITKGGAQPGDTLILSKALGTGIVTTALKQGKASGEHVAAAVASMSRLNATAAQLAIEYGVHAMTDITGYSLLGHSYEMSSASNCDFVFDYSAFEWLPGVDVYFAQETIPGGLWRNHAYFSQWVDWLPDIDEDARNMLFDPQTSGGLLIAVPGERAGELFDALRKTGEAAQIIGEVIDGTGRIRVQA